VKSDPYLTHISRAKDLTTYSIDTAASGDLTVMTPGASRIFVVYHIYLINASTSSPTWTVKSGSTQIASFNIPPYSSTVGNQQQGLIDIDGGGHPVFLGRAVGEAFVTLAVHRPQGDWHQGDSRTTGPPAHR
jgi:hypothetical protein